MKPTNGGDEVVAIATPFDDARERGWFRSGIETGWSEDAERAWKETCVAEGRPIVILRDGNGAARGKAWVVYERVPRPVKTGATKHNGWKSVQPAEGPLYQSPERWIERLRSECDRAMGELVATYGDCDVFRVTRTSDGVFWTTTAVPTEAGERIADLVAQTEITARDEGMLVCSEVLES